MRSIDRVKFQGIYLVFPSAHVDPPRTNNTSATKSKKKVGPDVPLTGGEALGLAISGVGDGSKLADGVASARTLLPLLRMVKLLLSTIGVLLTSNEAALMEYNPGGSD